MLDVGRRKAAHFHPFTPAMTFRLTMLAGLTVLASLLVPQHIHAGSTIAAEQAAASSDREPEVTLANLLAAPDSFVNRRVIVRGYLVLHNGACIAPASLTDGSVGVQASVQYYARFATNRDVWKAFFRKARPRGQKVFLNTAPVAVRVRAVFERRLGSGRDLCCGNDETSGMEPPEHLNLAINEILEVLSDTPPWTELSSTTPN